MTRAGDWAKEVTGGVFEGPGRGGDLGNGARYLDLVTNTVWLGRYGAREAAAYYLGAGVEWSERAGMKVPTWHRETLVYLAGGGQPRSVREAAAQGIQDAVDRWSSRRA